MEETPRRVTIRTVAKDAGVSVTAVSKVLNNGYGVSEAMRRKVMTSVDKLGYRPSFAARGMRGQTDTIGVLLVDMRNPFLAELVEGIRDELATSGLRLMMSVGEAETAIERSLIDTMIDMRMDGLILVAPRLAAEVLSGYARQIPTVVIGHHEPTASDFDTINSDDEQGAILSVRHLVARGYRDIWMLSAPYRDGGYEVFHRREAGYLRAMEEAGLADRAVIRRSSSDQGQDMAELGALLDDLPRPGAVFCWSDIHAVPLLNLARERGLDVPAEVAVSGYDNSRVAALSPIGLTSVDQHGTELGHQAVTTLLRRIRSHTGGEHLLVTPELVTRSST